MSDLPEMSGRNLPPAEWFSAETSLAPVIPNAGRRAAIYARFSHLGERESSIERQFELCESYIESNGYVVVGRYADRARTGTKIAGREQLLKFLEEAAEGKFDLLVVEDIDRLGRALEVTVEIWKQLKTLKIAIHDTESGKLSPSQIGAMAGNRDEERAKIVKRNRLGKRNKAKKGGWVGTVCFGYQRVLVDAKSTRMIIVKHPKEAALVLEMFELYDRGVSPDRIAEIFNLRPAEERGHRFWIANEIRGSRKYGHGFLRRLRYAGYSVLGRNSVEKDDKGKYTVTPNPRDTWAVGRLDESLIIVPHDLFGRVQDRLDRDKKGSRDPMWTVNDYPLRGRLFCATCGAGMTPTLKRNDGKPRIMCNLARNPKSVRPGSKTCSNGRSTSLEQVNEMIREILCREIAIPAAFERFVDEYNIRREAISRAEDTERPELERSLKGLKTDREDLWNHRGSFGGEFVDQKAAELSDKITMVERRLALLNAAPKGDLKLDRNAIGTLALEIEEMFNENFDSKTATGSSVIATVRKLIKQVVVDITDDTTSVEIHCNVAAITGSCVLEDVVEFTWTEPRTGSAWEGSKAEVRRIDKLVENGTYALLNAEWEKIGPLIPDSIVRSNRGSLPVNPRHVVDAALLHLNEGVPLSKMPAAFGNQDTMYGALKRLSSSGAWDMIVGVLRPIAPHRIPTKSSSMFCTTVGRYSSALRDLPEKRARHGVEVAAGKFAPTDAEWQIVSDLIPEQVLMVHKGPAKILPRTFLHGILYMLKSGTLISHMPLHFGSEEYFFRSIQRLVLHGYWDNIVERLLQQSPNTLVGADLSRFDPYRRSSRKTSPWWRGTMAKAYDLTNVPSHALTDAEWSLIKHLFPIEILYVNEKLAVSSPYLLAHALLYRVKEKIPLSAFPPHFGNPRLLDLTIVKFVFHHLWEEMVRILQEKSPATLLNADLRIFSKYKRARTRRYANLLPAVELITPPHAPSDAHWALVKDLIPEQLLVVRGKPVIMEPRKFLHAILYMATEHVGFGGLPKEYFGSTDDIRFAIRKLVRHHLWDTMVARFRHFDESWSSGLDLTLFDKIERSANENPAFREHRIRRTKAPPVIALDLPATRPAITSSDL